MEDDNLTDVKIVKVETLTSFCVISTEPVDSHVEIKTPTSDPEKPLTT